MKGPRPKPGPAHKCASWGCYGAIAATSTHSVMTRMIVSLMGRSYAG